MCIRDSSIACVETEEIAVVHPDGVDGGTAAGEKRIARISHGRAIGTIEDTALTALHALGIDVDDRARTLESVSVNRDESLTQHVGLTVSATIQASGGGNRIGKGIGLCGIADLEPCLLYTSRCV